MNTRYFLDTDTFIYIKNNRPSEVLRRFNLMETGTVGVSVISFGELIRGAELSQRRSENLRILEQLFQLIPVCALPVEAGRFYGEIRTTLERKGQIIGNNDLWIAAHALSLEMILITNNILELSRIEGLQIENWVG